MDSDEDDDDDGDEMGECDESSCQQEDTREKHSAHGEALYMMDSVLMDPPPIIARPSVCSLVCKKHL